MNPETIDSWAGAFVMGSLAVVSVLGVAALLVFIVRAIIFDLRD